jgi:hypothetical protein
MEPLQGGWTEGHCPSSAGVGGGGGGDCGTMAEAIEERRRTLGRLHFWRRQHYLSVIQKSGGSKSGRTPSQRELVMALIDRRRLLLSPPEQQQMEQEYRWLHEAAQGVVGDGGDNYDDDEGSRRGDGRPPRRPRLSVRHVSPRVLRAWVAKVARCVRSALSVSLSRACCCYPLPIRSSGSPSQMLRCGLGVLLLLLLLLMLLTRPIGMLSRMDVSPPRAAESAGSSVPPPPRGSTTART